jgi:hypothetical protein
MTRIFLSYSRRDLEVANRLTTALEQAGHEVWIDRQDIQTGTDWQDAIVRAIQDAEYFVLLLSANSVISPDVHKELTLADRERKRILPVLLHGVDVPRSMQYALVNLQTVDLFQNFETGLVRLLAAFEAAGETAAASDHGAKDRSLLLPDQMIGTPSERRRSMQAGALCWGVGCCLGSLLGAMVSRGFTGGISLVASATFIGAIFGAVFGVIFKKRVMDVVVIVVAPVFGMIVLMLVLVLFFRVALGLPFDDAAGLTAWAAGSVLAAGLWIVMKVWSRRSFVEQLKKTGRALPTQYKGVAENGSIKFNGRSPVRIVSQWRDPTTHQVHVFYSRNLWFDPSEFVQMNVITVYVDPINLSNYYMDTSFLPKIEK